MMKTRKLKFFNSLKKIMKKHDVNIYVDENWNYQYVIVFEFGDHVDDIIISKHGRLCYDDIDHLIDKITHS